MSKQDDVLQSALDALEGGENLDIVLARLPQDEPELVDLVRLASAVKHVPHPSHTPEPVAPLQRAARPQRTPVIILKGGVRRWLPALIGALTIFVLLITAGVGTLVGSAGPARARAATLLDVAGVVETTGDRSNLDWEIVESGSQLRAGDRIRTGVASEATLLFYDGSRLTMQPNTELEITQLKGTYRGGIDVVIDQLSGKTTHSVVPFQTAGSQYVVQTPQGTASVHGTNFTVGVDESGASYFAVRTGSVEVSHSGESTLVPSGQAVSASAGTGLDTPAYTFALKGELTFDAASAPHIAGQKVLFAGNQVNGGFQQGDFVQVEGRISPSGEWIADGLEKTYDEIEESSFTGTIDSMADPVWVISTIPVTVDPATTQLGDGLAVGVLVDVTFVMQPDGTRLATHINAVQTEPPPDAEPVLVFLPNNADLTGCDVNFTAPGILANTAVGNNNQATNVMLPVTIDQGAEYLNSIEIVPSTWAVINPGEQVSFNTSISLKPEFLQAPAGSQVRVSIFVIQEAGAPAPNDQRFTVTITSNCDNATLPVPTEIVPTEPVPTDEPGDEDPCTSAVPHLVGESLARAYGVPYEEIMAWKCMGFGFGEIDLAYGLSRETGIPVADLFNMKLSGEGWGNIKKWAESNSPANTPEPPGENENNPGNNGNNGQGNGNGNGNGNSNRNKDKDKNKNK